MKRSKERADFLFDVFVTALEGGIGSWSICHEYKWEATDPADAYRPDYYAVISEWDADASDAEARYGGAKHCIDAACIAKGVNRCVSNDVKYLGEYGRKIIADAARSNDAGEIDAPLASAIVEVALFGEVVFC